MNKDRQKRLGEALRENLKRRKQQARGLAGRAQERDAREGAEPRADGGVRPPAASEDKRR